MKKQRFVIIGSGYRSLFYVRIARALPEYFELCAMLCRTRDKAELMKKRYGIPVSVSENECRAMAPDFVVVAVNKASISSVSRAWAGWGLPVLCETPAGLELSELKDLWRMKTEKGARIQVAEQYAGMAFHKARLAVIRKGILGDPYSIDLSAAHDYHGASLIRRYLNVGMEQVCLYGKKYRFPVMETDSRSGPITDGRVTMADRMRAAFEFESGKTAFYDFSGIQYHSFIRGSHVRIQGVRGEWEDLTARYVKEDGMPEEKKLLAVPEPKTGMVSEIQWNSEIVYRNPYPDSGLNEDETAMAQLMEGMERLIETGEECYPLAEALQDAYMMLLMRQAAERPYERIVSEKQCWM